MRVFNPFAPSHQNTPLTQCFRKNEMEKRRAYDERVREIEHGNFSPPVFSTLGGIGATATVVYSRIASMLAQKQDKPYSKVMQGESLGTLIRADCLLNAVLHAPAAYNSSIVNSLDLVSQVLGYTPNLPLALPSAISSLARSARMTSWCSLEDIDVPLQQKTLSRLIDEACFNTLVESAPDVCSRALALSSSLLHVGDWLNVIPSPALHRHDAIRDALFFSCPVCSTGTSKKGPYPDPRHQIPSSRHISPCVICPPCC